jgi:hypothetical protein
MIRFHILKLILETHSFGFEYLRRIFGLYVVLFSWCFVLVIFLMVNEAVFFVFD